MAIAKGCINRFAVDIGQPIGQMQAYIHARIGVLKLVQPRQEHIAAQVGRCGQL